MGFFVLQQTVEKTREEMLQGYMPADYFLQILLLVVSLYLAYRMFMLWRGMRTGGDSKRMMKFVFVGSLFLVLSNVFEFAVVIYNQPWTFAKQWSVAPAILGWALIFYGVVSMLRSMGILPEPSST